MAFRSSARPLPLGPLVVFAGGVALLALFAARAVSGSTAGLPSALFDLWIFGLVHVVAIVLLVWRALVQPASRAPSLWLAVALVLWLAGWTYNRLAFPPGSDVPYPSLSDGFWLTYFVAVYGALVALLRGAYGDRLDRRFWADGLLVCGATAAVVLAAVLRPLAEINGVSSAAVATNLAYPLCDAVLVAVLVAAGALGLRRGMPQLTVLAAALVVQVLGDAVWFATNVAGVYSRGGPLDALFLTVPLMYAWAMWRPAGKPAAVALRRQVLLSGAAGVTAAVLLTYGALGDLAPAPAVLAALTLVGCALRAVTLMRHFEGLRRDRDAAVAASQSDDLTGLGNRRAFLAAVDASLQQAARARSPLALVLFSLDRLGDALGLSGSDAWLRTVEDRARRAAGPAGSAYRLDGGLFAVLVPAANGWEAFLSAQALAHDLRAQSDGTEITAGVAALAGEGGRDLLLSRADAALREATATRRAVVLWSPDLGLARVDAVEAERERHARSLAGALAKAVDAKDSYTRSHSETVASACLMIGRRLGLDEERLAKLRLGGLLHDVGKIGIPDAILQKPGALDDEEFAVMRTHSTLGAEILVAADLAEQARWVRHHHERIDGRGYPDGLAGDDIPLESRIILVADAFEAITSDRPYRRGRPAEQAVAELRRHAGTQFDPACVEALVAGLDGGPDGEQPDGAGAVSEVRPPAAADGELAASSAATPAERATHAREGVAVAGPGAAPERAVAAPATPRLHGRRSGLAAAAVLALLTVATMFAGIEDLGAPVYAVATSALLLACGVVAAATRRRAGIFLGAAMIVWAAGDAAWWLSGGDAAPVPSPADALYLAVYPLLALGLAAMLGAGVIRRAPGLWLDGAIAAMAFASIVAIVAARAMPSLEGDLPTVLVAAAYPLSDLCLAGVLAWSAALGRRITPAWVAVLSGVLVFTASDVAYLHQAAAGTYVAGGLVDWGWALAGPILAAAAWLPDPPAERPARERGGQLVVAVTLAVVSLGVLVYDHFVEVASVGLVLAGLSVAAAIARMARGFHEGRINAAASFREARTDALTGLANRRALIGDLEERLAQAERVPCLLLLFDLDGFKDYNDTFGHPAGDALLARMGAALAAALPPDAMAYRMGGDEFCVLVPVAGRSPAGIARACSAALSERGAGFEVAASGGSVLLPEEARDAAHALGLADQRLYGAKRRRRSSAGRQVADALTELLRQRDPGAGDHLLGVAELAEAVGRRVGLAGSELDALRQAAALHDLGIMAIPESLLDKAEQLTDQERAYLERHPLIAEKVLRAAPALDRAAALVRSAHERFDGTGYPDGLVGEAIPLGSRIVAVCDAFDAMISPGARHGRRTVDEALAELRRSAGTQFDPHVVGAFARVMDERAQRPVATAPTAA